MNCSSELKSSRILSIYTRLMEGEMLDKQLLAQSFNVTERSIQRDIETLRCFFAEQHIEKDIVYNKKTGGYSLLSATSQLLDAGEMLAVCKILLESRSLPRDIMHEILDKLLQNNAPTACKKAIQFLVANEKHHYIPPRHGKNPTEFLWELGEAIQHQQLIEIDYLRAKDNTTVSRSLQPVGLLFSEYYFYLVGFIEKIDRTEHFDHPDDSFPTIYRVDRIQSLSITNQHFSPPYANRFEEGEFRKRIQFMYGGRLQTIRFRYTGPSLDAILDRLPTAQVINHEENGYLISAEVFGTGIDMWLRSQTPYVTLCVD